ncbi:MAG: hypothetical protein AAGC55_25760, partial [Myxococcota bacterium]
TTLIGAWASFESALARACAGASVRHTIQVDTGGGRSRRLVMWLDPGLKENQAIFGAHPMSGS